MRVRLTPRAVADREAIFRYLRERSPVGARRVMSRLRQATRLLSEQPHAAPATDEPAVHVLFVGKYPYKVFYRVREDVVEVLHIRHTARAPSEFEQDQPD